MKNAGSFLLYGTLRLVAYLPLSFLFLLSDCFLYPMVYRVVGYRLKVVRANLKNSFPNHSKKDLRSMERAFYHHFCDMFLETIKVLGMSEQEAKKRMIFTNPELVTNFAKKGQGVLLVLGHYGNWEYVPFFFLHMLKSGTQEGANIYRPLKNKAFDDLFLRIRSHFGAPNVTKNDTYRTIIRMRKEGKAAFFGLISDQSPSRANLHYWTTFLHQDTAMLIGPERMAKQTGFAVVYADVEKKGRGHYQTTFQLITDLPKDTAEFEITERYARLMETTILREPAYWLWTHKRWKHKRVELAKKEEDMVQ